MVMCVHFINEKASVCKVASLTDEAVWCKLTGEIIYNNFWGDGEAGIDGGEDVVTTFSDGNSVKAETDTVGTPEDKDAASQFVARVRLVELVAITNDVATCIIDWLVVRGKL